MNAFRTSAGSGFNTIIFAGIILLSQIVFNSFAQPLSGGETVDSFFAAIQENDTNTVFKMLDANTNLTRALYYGRLPLHVAAQKGYASILARLLHDGADINAENDSLDTSNAHLTALDIAIWYNHPEVCRLLLNSNANPNLLGYHDGSALHLAFIYNRPEMAGWLLDHGANPFLENEFPYNHATSIDVAIDRGQGKLVPRMLKLMAKFSKPPNTPPSRFNPSRRQTKGASEIFTERGIAWLAGASQHGELEAVDALLKTGVSAKTNAAGTLPLLQNFALAEAAASKGDGFDRERWLKIRDLLIQNGAEYDAFAATAMGDLDRAQKLFAADKNVAQSRDHDGQTPLHWAVKTDRLPLVSYWIESGAPLAVTNFAGQTALHVAAANGKTEFAKVLLAAEAATNIRDTNGWTPLDAAIQAKQTETIRLLLASQPNSTATHLERAVAISIHDAAASGNITALAVLTETTNHLEARNELGLTPLQVAVQHGHLAAAALLVDMGADVNARDPDGNTMLIWLVPNFYPLIVSDRPPTNWLSARLKQNPHKEEYLKNLTVGQYEQGPPAIVQTASFLLLCGIDINATNHAGKTAVQLAADEKFILYDREPFLKLLGTGGGNMNEADADGNTALHQAGQDTLVDRIAALIASGANINATNHLGQTPLHKFAEKIGGWDLNEAGDNQPFQLLVKSKANVNAQDNDGLTPLHVVLSSDSMFKNEATHALLDAGANPNLQDHQGMTPLLLLAKSGNNFSAEPVKAVLDAGANPNFKDKHGRTPAHLFLDGKWPWDSAGECIPLLVKAGADLSVKDDQGKTPLHYLAALGSQSPFFFIRGIDGVFVEAKVDFQARDNDGNTPLHIAAKSGTRDVFDWLVKQGAGLDETNNAGETPRLLGAHNTDRFSRFSFSSDTDIFQAVREGKMESLEALLKADAKLLDESNQFGQTPLRVAVISRRTNVVEFLEQKGVRWDAVSAVMFGRAEVLRGILLREPKAATTTDRGSSLLHLAAVNGDVPITKQLLDAGGDLRAQDLRGLSPLGVALLKNQLEEANALRQRGGVENLFDAVFIGDLEVAKALVSKDKSMTSATNQTGTSVMEIAAGTGHTDILKLFLDRGGQANTSNPRDGRTPLHVAAIHNQTNTAKLLLRRGAKVDAPDQSGLTPLHLASIQGATEAAAVLLEYKANLNVLVVSSPASKINSPMMMGRGFALTGNSPLHLAALFGQTNIIQLLLKSGALINTPDSTGRTPLDLAAQNGPNPRIFSLQRILIGMGNSMGSAEPTQNYSMGSLFERQKVAATLLEKAGGKHSQAGQPFRGPTGF
jgi:ankyrin repeat protein